jgi:16S rRNA processing protein RimM
LPRKKLPEKLVEMGRISAPFGIKGWVRVQPYSGATGNLANCATWWLDGAAGWQEYAVQQAQVQGPHVVAKLAGCEDRDAADRFKGRVVAVPREAFPPVEQGEFYWADLVGLKVRNSEGLDFGVVSSMVETGANAVMVVQQSAVDGDTQRERLIPFIADVIKRVDIAAGLIEVDWGADFLA